MTGAEKYFNGEIYQCTIGAIIGIVSIAIGVLLRFWMKTDFYSGLSWPFICTSLLLMIICIGVIVRSPKDIKRVKEFEIQHSEKIKTEELPRMHTVMKNFRIIKVVEISLMLIAIVMVVFAQSSLFIRGIGAGLLIQCAIMLAFDILAEKRGAGYVEYLGNFIKGI